MKTGMKGNYSSQVTVKCLFGIDFGVWSLCLHKETEIKFYN